MFITLSTFSGPLSLLQTLIGGMTSIARLAKECESSEEKYQRKFIKVCPSTTLEHLMQPICTCTQNMDYVMRQQINDDYISAPLQHSYSVTQSRAFLQVLYDNAGLERS